MLTRPVVILLDIDGTLIDLDASRENRIVWNGTLYFWQKCLDSLREAASQAPIDIHYGIATFKSKAGDSLSAAVLETDESKENKSTPGNGLKKWLNPDLLYFTGNHCKVKNGLDCIKNTFPGIRPEDIFIIDDIKEKVCDIAEAQGYNAVWVGNDLAQLTQDSRTIRIAKAFAKIFEKLNLPIPSFIQSELNQPETTLEQAQPTLAQNRNRFTPHPAFVIPTQEELSASGIQGLDDDELAPDKPPPTPK